MGSMDPKRNPPDMSDAKCRRHFTEAAREAAKAARLRKREQGLPRGLPEVFVVRTGVGPLSYGWEIRVHGGVVLGKGNRTFTEVAEARRAGESIREGMLETGPDGALLWSGIQARGKGIVAGRSEGSLMAEAIPVDDIAPR